MTLEETVHEELLTSCRGVSLRNGALTPMAELQKTFSVIVLGASGATGSPLLHLLQQSPRIRNITTVVRRPLKLKTEDKLTQIVVPDLGTHDFVVIT